MAKLLALISLALVVALVLAGDGEMSEEDNKNAKMVFCGKCKDDAMMATIKEFHTCMKDSFPDQVDKATKIHQEHKDDLEGCWTEMAKLMGELKQKEPDQFKKAGECFHKHIPDKTKLATCH